ncbi:MAG: hypothetical protein RR942_06555 [Romboutsia sp.]
MTNFERIKNMAREQLAEEIRLIANWDKKELTKANKIDNWFLEYLDKEVDL